MMDDAEKVVGSHIGGAKIGGDVDDAFLLFPDPMGATGGSLVHRHRALQGARCRASRAGSSAST